MSSWRVKDIRATDKDHTICQEFLMDEVHVNHVTPARFCEQIDH